MSADNYIGVIATKDGKYGVIPYGNMSMLDEDCQYRGAVQGSYFDDRATALIAAHDALKEEYIVEYGVIELTEPDVPCGRCYVCINERNIVADDVQRCDACGEPIHSSEWRTTNANGTYHN